jgi:hypothetical protein
MDDKIWLQRLLINRQKLSFLKFSGLMATHTTAVGRRRLEGFWLDTAVPPRPASKQANPDIQGQQRGLELIPCQNEPLLGACKAVSALR